MTILKNQKKREMYLFHILAHMFFLFDIMHQVLFLIDFRKGGFEYIYPYVDFSKSFNNLSYSLNGYNKKFNTNQDLLNITNKIIYSPNEKYFASGLKSDWSLIFKNTNLKVDKAAEKQRNDLKGGFHYNISLPMINRNERFNGILDPKV